MSVNARGDLGSGGAIALSPKKERLLLPDSPWKLPWKIEDPKESQRIEHGRRITRVRPHTAQEITRVRPHTAQETCLGNSVWLPEYLISACSAPTLKNNARRVRRVRDAEGWERLCLRSVCSVLQNVGVLEDPLVEDPLGSCPARVTVTVTACPGDQLSVKAGSRRVSH